MLVSLLWVGDLTAQTVLVGNQAVEANLDSNATGLAEAFPVTATASGTVGAINFFLDESSAATKIYVGIYKDSSGKPGSLLTQGSGTQFYPGTWNSISVTAASLTSGTAYWIAILGTTGGKPYFYDRSTTACHSQTSSQTNLTSLPSTWSSGTTWNTCYISAYAVTGTLPATAMIGNQAVEAYLDKNPAGRAEAFPATANTTGSVGAIALYLDPTSGTGPVSIGLYADNSGHPGTLLGQGSTTSPLAGTWNQISIVSSSITAGAHYWIAVLGTQATSPYFRDRQTTVCHSETTPQSNLTSLPSTWSTGTIWNTCYISAYGLAAAGSPVLSISPTSLSFAAIQGGANPASANLSVSNTGTGTLNFTDSTDQSWLSATPTSGTAPKTLQVSASVGSLTAGTYTGHVTVTATGAQNSPATATVTFTVSPFVPPSISASASPAPNANGWNNANVTLTFTCAAGSYPVQTCPAPIVVSTEGASQSTCGHAVDTQGNSSAQACASVSLDKTPPTIAAAVSPAPTGGINYGSATVTFTCSDALSAVATCPPPITDSTIGSNQNISGTATDKAGNSKTASVTLNIQPLVLPTLVATPSPAPNANGWNNANVTVTFTCTAGSYPIQTCPAPIVVSTEGANQSSCGHAVDTQGNSSAQACANVSLDKTAPTITAAVSPAPVGGINYGSATVTFTCSDALSGVATCPSPITDTTIGSNQNISGTATDKAGNSKTASVTLNIQPTTLPTIVATPSPLPDANGWNNSSVTVTFTCTAGSYPIQTCPSPIIVSTEGANQSTCGHAVDTQGNSSVQVCANVSLDKTPPTITAAVTPAPVGGINYASATVTFTCSDALSGVSTCPPPVTDTTIGSNQNISGTAADKAGNSNTASVTLNIQPLVLPTVTATPSPAPNSAGWNNANVTVTFTCTAGSYPVQTCPSPIVVSTEGANQSICGHAVDSQGNSSLTVCDNLNLDKTPPTITAAVTPAPVGGINYARATVTFTCSDALSGVSTCPPSITDTTIGSNQNISGTATDKAGNSKTASVTLNIQPLVLPTVIATPSPAPNANGWNNANVTVTFTCTAGSYPIQTCPSPIAVSTEGANQSTCGHAVDTQGNSSISVCDNVSIDKTPPTITASASPAPNAAGWNTTSVTVTFACGDALSGIVSCPSPQTVTTAGANQVVKGTATDVAGNTASAQVTLNISQTPPQVIPVVSPLPNGAGWNNTNVTVSFTCTAGGAPITSCPSPQVITTEGASLPVTGTVTDAAGVTATATVVIKLDKTPPSVIPNISPAPNASGWETAPVTVSFTCNDSLSGVAVCPSSTVISSDGANQPVSGTATDVAGNSATATAIVNLEQALPTISASASPAANSYGWNNTSVTVTFTCNKSTSTIVSCSSPQTVSAQGLGQVITGTVQDQAGSQSTTSVTLNIDETPPAILQFTGPSQLSPGQSGTASLSVSDIAPVASVVFQLNGIAIGTVLAPPYTVTVTAPSSAISGSTLTVTAIVTDVAGNASSANIGIKVASSGVVVGQVLADATGLPLAGANLQVVGQTGQSATSDSEGRYSIPVTSSQLFLSVSQPGNSGSGIPAMVTVERQVSVQSGVGTVPVDARLTALAAPTVITGSGGTLGAGATTVTVPAGGTTTSFNLTPLSQQGLPGLLPLGWSPVAAFDLQANASTSAALSANFTGLSAATLYLVSYSYNVHTWTMVTPNLSASSGALTVSLPSTGDYALVVPDAGNTSLQIPAVGQPLTGVPMVSLPTTATSTGSLSPANLAPTGGTSMASLAVQSATALPSGTVIQSEVTEKYTLTTGQLISDEPRYEDILLYQYPAPSTGSAVGATFPITPSQTFQPSQLSSGDVHLDILSGRESVRGQTGGSDPVAVTSGDATLTVAAGSLSQDTAIAVSPEGVDVFVPSTSTLVPLSEYNLDFSGGVLTTAAQLSVGTAGALPGSNVVIAQIQRVGGVPFLVVVGTAQVTTTNLVSQVTPGLPGITQGGDYVFYELTVPTGFVSGTVSASSGPVAAMVQTDALPFVAFSNSTGGYKVVAAAGTVSLTASIANTALAGSAMAQVVSGQTATVNISVAGQVESTTITPANGAVGVPLTAEIDVVAADGFNPATVTSSSVVLTAAGITPVALRFVYSSGNTKLAIFPQVALQPSTQYTFQASGLANALGGLISVPTISFTTAAITPPAYNTNALVFAMPDQNGNVAISAPANSFPAGSTILIVDETNGVVYSLTVFNDGSVTGQMPATINDVLQVTLTDPAGSKTTFTISQFVAADGTTAVGPGGGTVVGPGNTGIIIPAGALPQGVTFQLTQLDQTAFPILPTWTGVNFGSGLRIHDPAMPTFKKEAKLAFPVPAGAPSNAFYYVYRRLMDQNGNPYFETIDEAFVQGTGANAQVVTASPPFCGYHNSFGNFKIQADSPPLPITMQDQDYFVMWDATAQHGPSGIASTGLIVGLATQVVPAVIGVSAATTQPAQGTVTISLDTTNNVAIYDGQCATFSLFDPLLGGGSRAVTASDGTTTLHATVAEVDGAQSDDGLYAIYAGLEDLYKNIGRVNFLFPSAIPPPPPPAINVQVFTLNQYGHRVPAGGILQTGTNVVIAFQSGLSVQSASINGSQLDVETPDSTDGEVLDGLPEQSLLSARAKKLYPLGGPGAYTITATGVDPISLTVTTASQSILVVAAGGSNTSTFTCTAAQPPADPTTGCTLPQVVSISPTNLATSVSPAVFPVVTFNEPVTNISSANVALTVANVPSNPASQIGSVVPVVLVGVRVPNPNNPNQSPIADPVQPSDVITSLTIEPVDGLGYSETYNFTLNASAGNCLNGNNNPAPPPLPTSLIVDQNQSPAGPLCLAAYGVAPQPYQFTTFGPQDLGGVASQYEVLTRPVVIGNTAYAGEYLSSAISGLGMFDVTDPSHPKDLLPGASFVGRAIDVAGQAQSPVTGAGLVAISAGTAVDNTIPANVWLYDVSSPTKPNRVGAVSVTSDTSFGIALRLFMKDQYLYASTFEQGLQVIDLGQAIAEYSQTSLSQFGQAVSTAGDGFAMDAIVNTIPIPLATGGQATMFDLKADNFATTGGSTQTLVVAAGQLPFVMVDPTLSGSSAILYPPNTGGTFSTNPVQSLTMTSSDGKTKSLLCYGTAVDIGTLAVAGSNGNSTSEHIAVVIGNGITGPVAQATGCPILGQPPALPAVPVLAVVNVSTAYAPGSPFTPQLIGFLQLPTTGTDVTLNGSTALISTGSNVLLVSLENPAQPTSAGQITGSFGNWLAINSAGLIVGSSNNGSNGIQTSTLGPYISLQQVVPAIVNVDDSGNTTEPIQLTLNAQGQVADLANATVTYSEDGTTKATIPIGNLQPGLQTVTIPAGVHTTSSSEIVFLSLTAPDGTQTPSVVLSLNGPTFVPPAGSSGSPPTTAYPVYAALPAPFDSVSPTSIQLASGDAQVTVFGASAVGLTQVFVRGLDLNWIPIAASSSGPTSVQFVIPASLLSQAGFLEVAPTEDDSVSIPLLVYDPSLPALGSAAGVELDYATADDLDTATADTVTVSGLDLPAGATVILGRGVQPGYVLPTTQVGPGTLQAQIPAPFAIQADDLFVAVLSANSGLSAALPLPRASLSTPASGGYEGDPDQPIATINPGVDPNEASSTAQFGAADVGITSVSGNLIATLGDNITHPAQTLTINGVNLADGLLVTFTTMKGGQLVQATAPLSGTQTLATLPTPDGSTPSNPAALMSSTVVVPPQILDPPLQDLHPSTPKAPGTHAPVASKQPPVVPFGGRRQFGVYQGPNKEYRILPTSQVPANYTAATGATISIANAAPNPTHFPQIQLEQESNDPPNTERIRGTALFQLPCADIKRIKGVSASLPCDPTARTAAQIQATQNGKVVATLSLESQYESLGGNANQFDPVIALYADQYGIPPHFIKSQAATESQTYTLNFRHEFTSIDLRRLSQDGPDAFASGGQRRFATEPWSHYVYGGQGVLALGGYTSQAVQDSAQETQKFLYDLTDPSNTTFELGIAVKRTAGTVLGNLEPSDGTEEGAKVFASIQTLAGQPVGSPLTLVHSDTVWQKAGCLKCPDSLSTGIALQNLKSTQFAVNYSTGVVTLGAPLQSNQQLVVRYWPVGIGYTDLLQQTVTTISSSGNFVQNAPDLNTLATLKALQKLTYAPNKATQTLSDFLTTNLANGKKKGFLTTPGTNDRDVEFTVDQKNNPVSPRDPRYQFVMTQPYASSSYGFLQFTLLPFDLSTTKGQQLTAAFDPSQTALYELVTQLETNFSLAALYHSQSLSTLLKNPKTFVPCNPNNCNESKWEAQWISVFKLYNGSPAYANGTIVKEGAQNYTPVAPQ